MKKMKGLQEYIAKHGKHFTKKLAYKVVGNKWSFEEIDKSLQKKVYYNVSGCTEGDVVYYCNSKTFSNKRELIILLKVTLQDVGSSELLFPLWASANKNSNFDLTPYI